MVDELADGWYPGFRPATDQAAWAVEPFRPFGGHDEQRFWLLDFHWPRGLTPMGLVWIEDGYAWGSQLAAETLPLPSGRGLAQRFVGTHVYTAAIAVTDDWEIAERARRVKARLPAFVGAFAAIWAERRDELDRWWAHLSAVDLAALSAAELRGYLLKARRFLKRSAEIHFEIMYPLLVNYLDFHRSCTQMGIDASQIAKFLQGYETKIIETDRALGQLANAAHQAGLADVFATYETAQLRDALARHGGPASGWCAEFDGVMRVYGQRTAGPFDVGMPSWVEDPVPALGMIKSFLQKGCVPDLLAARQAGQDESAAAVDAARAALTWRERQVFDAGLASCQTANFPWWQDEHNYYIDLRAALPLRWGCLQVADRVGADLPDDTVFLFWPELLEVLDGRKPYDALRGLVKDRRHYYSYWSERRPGMPKWLGTAPESMADPILIEVFGLNRRSIDAMRLPGQDGSGVADAATLRGVPAAGGVARGTARVVFSADELHRVRPGDVLVCESITPAWTSVFGEIAACVCDSGGIMSHAAIVGREYRVPTVTAVSVATVFVHDGDEIEVDGTSGTVAILGPARGDGVTAGGGGRVP